LNYAVLAPSVANTQPWLFKVGGRNVAIYADRGIVNLISSIDEFSPLQELFGAISSKKRINCPKEYLFPTLRGK